MDNLAQLTEDFFKFESDYNLLSKTIDGVYYWNLVRSRVYDSILTERGDLGPIAHTVPRGALSKISAFIKYCFNAAVNYTLGYKQADTLIINHPRKVLVDGEYHDIYTKWLIDELKSKGENYLVLDYPQNWSVHYIKRDDHTRNLENFSIVKKVYYKFFAKNTIKDNPEMSEIASKLREVFGTDGNFISTCFSQINIFKADYNYYLKLLKKIKPKRIYYVVINAQRGLIAAAKELGIPIEEIQHGAMYRYGLNYSFPGVDYVPYFPTRMCLFGKYWKDITPIPLGGKDFDYYQNSIRNHEPAKICKEKNNKVVIISQPTVGKGLFAFLSKIIKLEESREYEFIIKLHPSEFHVWRDIYPELKELCQRENVSLIDTFNTPLFDVLRQADSVIGVASTALFEALYFGCDVYLLDVAGADWMQSIMNEDIATLIRGEKEFFSQLKQSKRGTVDIDYIFAK